MLPPTLLLLGIPSEPRELRRGWAWPTALAPTPTPVPPHDAALPQSLTLATALAAGLSAPLGVPALIIAPRGRARAALEEECGDGYVCTVDDAHGYGCAPDFNSTQMVCCSAGQPESAATACCAPGRPCDLTQKLPLCPAGGASGSGCVRAAGVRSPVWRHEPPIEPIAALRSLAHSFGLVGPTPGPGDEALPLVGTNGTGHDERADRRLLPPLPLTLAVAIAGLAAAALIWAICVFMLMPLPRPRRPADALRALDEWDKRRAGPTSPAWASRFSAPGRAGAGASAARG